MEGKHMTVPKPRDLHLGFVSKSKAMSPKISGQIYSPVTDLAMNLGELTTVGYGNTPKRRLSLSSIGGTPTPTLKPLVLDKQLSFGEDSPAYMEDSPFMRQRFGDLMQTPSSFDKTESPRSKMRSSALRRFQAMPVPFCGFEEASPDVCQKTISFDEESSPISPIRPKFYTDEDETSQDSGVCLDHLPQPKFLETDFRFAEPCGRPPARRVLRILSDETNSPCKYSPKKPWSTIRQMSLPDGTSDMKIHSFSPIKLHSSSLTHSSDDDEGDDGFLDLVDIDDAEISLDAPSTISGLFTAPMLANKNTPGRRHSSGSRSDETSDDEDIENEQPQFNCSRRGLFRSPRASRILHKSKSFCVRPRALSFKRSEPCHDDATPIQSKRRKSIVEVSSPCASPIKTTSKPTPTLQRCHSETDAMIKSALNRYDSQPDLIGDFSKKYCLKLSHSKHQDLKGISPETMADVLNGEYDHIVERAIIIDARYPYEFDGGHIRGALNLWTKGDIMDTFLEESKPETFVSKDSNKRTIIIFHCEFSSERGPGLSRFLRNKDRDANKECYPSLNYPELYLLEGGYKAFFYKFKELCDPHTYKPMLHEDHQDDLRYFRAKSKSWAGEKCGGRKGRVPFRPGLKAQGLKL